MANIYVRSTDGSNADNGSTWALAKLDLVGAAAIDAAGDTIYVSQAHAESTAAQITFVLAGTLVSPTKIICGDDAAEPPTTVSTSGSVSTTGASGIIFSGASFFVRGLIFNIGSGANLASMSLATAASARVHFQLCDFIQGGSNGGNVNANSTGGTGCFVVLEDCRFKFASSAGGLRFSTSGTLLVQGGSIISGGTSLTALVVAPGASANHVVRISGMDLTNAAAGMHIFTAGNFMHGVIRNSKLPASWSGSLVTGTIAGGSRYEMHNCDSGDTNYSIQIVDACASLLAETTVVRTGGASNGTTTMSWKIATTADAEYPQQVFESPEIVVWNETTGSAITVTVETVTDNVTLTDAEAWLEVEYLGTSGVPLGTFGNDAKADVLATAANQTSSAETWTTTGLTTPVKQKLSVTFTPQEKGFVHAVVKVAKASTTVYVCPKLTVA